MSNLWLFTFKNWNIQAQSAWFSTQLPLQSADLILFTGIFFFPSFLSRDGAIQKIWKSEFDFQFENTFSHYFFIFVFARIFKFRKIISDRKTCQHLVSSDHPVYIDRKVEETEHYRLYEGHFWSPLVDYLHDLVPKESQRAYFQLILPTKWPSDYLRPLCVQLAGTGDHVITCPTFGDNQFNFWLKQN